MKLQSLLPAIVAVCLLASCASRPDLSARVDLLGDPAPLAAATRTVVIAPDTRSVDVTGGDTVKFIVGDQAFAWHFSGAQSISAIHLHWVAPAGIVGRDVVVHVAPDPLYSSEG